jgi:2-polyprenyl-6-methoxyphenol hydroxylase-like FAD-dependent oxidoreductase
MARRYARVDGHGVTRTQVLIAGGGPVGMTLALVLAEFGVRSILVERNETTTRHPKMDITNARSMELFARIGLAEKLRAAAVAESQRFDVAWITTLTGEELHRFVYPSVAEWRSLMRERNDGTMPSEPPMRVSQVIIEPVLKDAIDAHPLVDVHFGTAFEGFEQDEDGVTATLSTGETIRADYLIGCDGGNSRVRELLGIGLSGQAKVAQRFITHFHSTDTHLLQRWGPAWHYQSDKGTLVAQNDRDTWTLLSRFPDGLTFDEVDPSALIEAFVGAPIAHEVIVCNAWWPNLLVADSFGENRVWLAGDSVHQVIPTGGYGMNTGVGDAFDLGWKLAAVLNGFGGAKLIASYEQERRPVALANCAGSARHNGVRLANGALYEAALEQEELARRIAEHGNRENESFALEMGYSYHASPVILPSPTEAPSADPVAYVPSTMPGSRLPSVYLADGSNMYDHLGPWFTLLCVGACDSAGFAAAACALGVPVKIANINGAGHEGLYAGPALLIRPDQHIAWRGVPQDLEEAMRLLRHVLGHGGSPSFRSLGQ